MLDFGFCHGSNVYDINAMILTEKFFLFKVNSLINTRCGYDLSLLLFCSQSSLLSK